jgi:hypothetical protein
MNRVLLPLAAVVLALLPSLTPLHAQTASAPGAGLSPPGPYVVDLVATAAFGVDMNDAGDVIGTSYPDVGCGSSCLPPLETVVWRRGRRIVLPTVAGLQGITVTGMNDRGWIVGFAGFSGTTTHAVVWKPTANPADAVIRYEALDLGNLPGRTISTATGIDEFNRVVGWSTTSNFPPNGAPFLWTEAGGMVDLSAQGFPDEPPLGISPGGTVATYGYWYRLGDPASVRAMPPPPPGFMVENSAVAINDAGDQARFLVDPTPQILDYPFRFHHEGTWQQLSSIPTGHLTRYGIGSINDARDVTVTVASTGMIAYGPDGLAQPLAPLVSPAYGGGDVVDAEPMNASGEILARMMIGRSSRLVRLVPGAPCTADCIRVTDLQIRGRGPAYCDQGQDQVGVRLTVTDEAGVRLQGVTVAGRFFDDYWLDEPVAGQTNARGQVTFTHVGPPCVGAVAFLVTDASSPGRTLDRTTGTLTDYVIPLPNEAAGALSAPAAFVLEGSTPNPFSAATTIHFSLPEPAPVRLVVYDALGREVARLVDAVMEAGSHEVRFEASGFPGGVYLARLTTGTGRTQTLRLTLLR